MTEQHDRARDRGHRAHGIGDATRPASTPVRALPLSTVRATLVWVAAYSATIWLGHLTLVGGTDYPLFWPAAGVALLWTATARARVPALVLVGLVGAATLLLLHASRGEAAAALLAVPSAMAAFGTAYRTWRGPVRGHGVLPVETLRDYGVLVFSAVVATVVDGLVSAVVLAPEPGPPFGAATQLAIAHGAAMVTIGGTGLVLAHWVDGLPHVAGGLPRSLLAGLRRDSTPSDVLAVGVAVALAVGVFVAGYVVFPDAPVSFVLVIAVAGVAIRFSPSVTGVYAVAVVAVTCWLTMDGRGPVADIPDPQRRVFAFALFATALLVTGLTIALSRRERDEMIGRLQESERAAEVLADDLALVLANLEEGVAVVEEGGRFLHANPAIGRLLEMPDFNTERVEPVDSYHLVHPDGRPLQESEVPHARVFAGEEEVHDVVHLRRDDVPGDRVYEVFSRRLPQIRAGDLPRAVTTIRDVTAEQQQRDALTSFAQVVAHDLRNPLTSVSFWATELLDACEAGHVDPDTAAMMLRHIESSTSRMQNFISDLLSYAVARDQTPSPVPVELAEVVESVVQTITAGDGVEPTVRYDRLPVVWCDPVLLPQLFDNLIANSVKYVAPGVVPEVRIEATPLPDDWTRVRVVDNGIGIAPEDRLRVFETFERARATEYEGTGLGLAICRHIVERHGGTIGVAPPPDDRGTCIELTLPTTDAAFERAVGAPDA